jgi:hypothetical protein
MSQDLSKLSDEELLQEFGKIKPSPIFDAFFIGFLVGIIIFGVVAKATFFAFLIPLFLIYLFLKKPRRYNTLQKELKRRGLKQG